MFPSVDPKKMKALMRQMGINQEEVNAKRVVIECENNNLVINNPSVVKVNMQGQTSFQISGDVSEEDSISEENHNEEDIQTIIEKTGCSEDEARKALENSKGDLTEAILSLS